MALVAKTLGWSRAELLEIPEEEFATYLRVALRAHNVDPDSKDRGHFEFAPPAEDEEGKLTDAERARLKALGVTPLES